MTDTITVYKKNHASLKIECDDGVAAEIGEAFSFMVPNYKFSPAYKRGIWDGKIRLFNSRSRELPVGLYESLKEFADEEGRSYNLETKPNYIYGTPGETANIDSSFFDKLVISTKGVKIRPYDYQSTSVKDFITNKNMLLVSPTGSGKSLIIYMALRWYIKHYSKDVLIVVPTKGLVKQMISDFADYSQFDDAFDASQECVGIMGGLDKQPKNRIIVSTWQSIYKLDTAYFSRFGLVVGDEAHQFAAKNLTDIMSKCQEGEFRLGTTGTLGGGKTNEMQLTGLFGQKYQIITTKQLMDDDKLANLSIKLLALKYSELERKAIARANDYQTEVDFLSQHDKRNRFIRNLALAQNGNTLVLFRYVDKHGIPLYDAISAKAAENRKVFYVSGKTDVESREEVRALTEKENDAIIVASLGTFSTGINIKNIHNIIFAAPSKSQIKVLQSIGRGLRIADDGRGCTLYDIVDDLSWKKSENYTLKHARERTEIYTREKFKFKLIEIDLEKAP